MKEVGKIYSAVDADELEAGDIVELTNYPKAKGFECVIDCIREYESYPFCVKADVYSYLFAKLICPKKHAEVYKAFKNGAKVEFYYNDALEWLETANPTWDEDTKFRIAEQKPTYRPFKDIDELVETWTKMMGYKAKPNTMPLIWVRLGKVEINEITGFNCINNVVRLREVWYSMKDIFDGCTFLDGTPFGVRED